VRTAQPSDFIIVVAMALPGIACVPFIPLDDNGVQKQP
jgi:hypothetical protein